MVINKNYLINGRAERAEKAEKAGKAARGETSGSASRTGRDVGRVGQVGRVRVRAKASECMELGMWGRLWDRWGR